MEYLVLIYTISFISSYGKSFLPVLCVFYFSYFFCWILNVILIFLPGERNKKIKLSLSPAWFGRKVFPISLPLIDIQKDSLGGFKTPRDGHLECLFERRLNVLFVPCEGQKMAHKLSMLPPKVHMILHTYGFLSRPQTSCFLFYSYSLIGKKYRPFFDSYL